MRRGGDAGCAVFAVLGRRVGNASSCKPSLDAGEIERKESIVRIAGEDGMRERMKQTGKTGRAREAGMRERVGKMGKTKEA